MSYFYDLGIAWEWEYDFDFVNLILQRCKEKQLKVCDITPENLSEIFNAVKRGDINFLAYFDRASDVNEHFADLNLLIESLGVRVINRYGDMIRASDKATMHLELLNAGVSLPYTLILPPFDESPDIKIDGEILNKIKIPFIVKPSSETGGGIGVKIGYSIDDIIEARKEFPYDKYLVQEIIQPVYIDGRKAWFRVFYAFGKVLICWWDNEIKIYERLKSEELEKYELGGIEDVMRKIYSVCKLDFFSSEVALAVKDGERKFISVDYVNEIPDMRLKSKAIDGVPDEVVEMIAGEFAEFVTNLK